MKKLLELRQQKAALKTQMRNMLEKADTEKRSLNEEEGKQFDELRAQADALEIDITRLEAVTDDQRNLPGTSVEGKPVSNDELRHYIMTGDTRSLSTMVQGDGGYTVIPELDREIMRQLQDDSVMRSICTVKTTKPMNTRNWSLLAALPLSVVLRAKPAPKPAPRKWNALISNSTRSMPTRKQPRRFSTSPKWIFSAGCPPKSPTPLLRRKKTTLLTVTGIKNPKAFWPIPRCHW